MSRLGTVDNVGDIVEIPMVDKPIVGEVVVAGNGWVEVEDQNGDVYIACSEDIWNRTDALKIIKNMKNSRQGKINER